MKILNNVKRNKIVSFFLFCLLAFCLVVSNMGLNDTLAKTVQIENEGGSTAGDGINVSKVISATDIENVFDITLNIETETEVSKMYENPPMSVVVVMDISNSMFTPNSSTGDTAYDDAMEAMKGFINQYSEDAKESIVPRELAVVTFNTDAYVRQPLVDCSGNIAPDTIYDSILNGINNSIDLSTYGTDVKRFTNVEAGLRLAENILDSANTENKFIILISDGLPTTYSRNANDSNENNIEGYSPVSTEGIRGTEGVFYSELHGGYCEYGTSYSDTAAIKARKRATAIKDKDINIYCMGVNIGDTSVEGFADKRVVESNTGYSNATDIYNALDINNSEAKGTYNHPYKDWLYNEIGNQYYKDGNDYYEMCDVYNEIYEILKENGQKIVIDSWKVADPMNQSHLSKKIEFLKFFNKSGELTDLKTLEGTSGLNAENSASFSTSSETITWNVPVSGYTTKTVSGKTMYCYSLKYRVRLKNEADGFVSGVKVPTNGTTTLNYLINSSGAIVQNDIEFKVPEVKGYLAGFSFTKVDEDNDTPLSGVAFKLSHKDSCSICEAMGTVVGIADKTAVSDGAGKVKFSSIPSGHEYILTETSTIEGYILDTTEYQVSVEIGEVKINGGDVFDTLGNMPESFKLTYVIVTPEADCPADDKTNPTPDMVTGILYGRDVVIEEALDTNAHSHRDGRPGEWIFSGWYEDASCTGNTIDEINITEDETVYGKWEFIPDTYKVEYVLTGDPVYGMPTDNSANVVPSDNNVYNYNDEAIVKPQKDTAWTTADGTENTTPGTWYFTGWYDNSEYTGTALDKKIIRQNETFYGKWEFIPNTYTLDYVIVTPSEDCPAADKTDDTPDAITGIMYGKDVKIENALNTEAETDRDGRPGEWIFSGWYEDASCTGNTIDEINITEDETVYGKWEFIPDTYKVEYVLTGDPVYGMPTDNNADVVPSDNTVYNYNDEAIVKPQKDTAWTTADGTENTTPGTWYFTGWYDNSEYTGTALDKKIIRQNETFYGKWEFIPNKVGIKYEVEGDPVHGIPSDSVTPVDDTVYEINDSADVKNKLSTLDTSNKNGVPGAWTFDGWYYDEDYIDYVDTDSVILDESKTLFGKWSFVSYTYTLDYVIKDTGFGTPDASKTEKVPDMITEIPYNTDKVLADTINTTDTEKDGVPGVWVFTGWYDNEECIGTPIEEINIKQNETVYGTWKFSTGKFNVEYVVEGDPVHGYPTDSVTPVDESDYLAGSTVIIKDTLVTDDDKNSENVPGEWTFDGWFLDGEYTKPVEEQIIITKNEIFYGKWSFVPDTYTLDYVIVDTGFGIPDAGLTDATPEIVTDIPYDTDKTLANELLTRDGEDGVWVFKGWFEKSDCSGNTIKNINIKQNETVYGTWEYIPNKYKVEYEITGDIIYGVPTDVVVPSIEIFDYEDLVEIKENLITGWITSDGTPDGIPGTWEFVIWDRDDFVIREDTTIYGKWVFTPKVYTLKYVIVSKENPSDMIIPSMVTDIAYDTDKVLADRLVTALDEKDGVEGVWTFKGWYDNEKCTGTAIDVKNIKQDEIVYGLWEFVPNGKVDVGDKTPVAAAIALILVSLTGMGIVIRKK